MKNKLTFPYLISVIMILANLQIVKAQYSDILVRSDSIVAEFTGEVNADSVESYIQFLQDKGTRFLIAPNRLAVAESIKEKFQDLGIQDVRIDSFYCNTVINYSNLHFDTVTTQYNVIATITGVTDFDSYVVMGAHYDCVVAPEGDPMTHAPGADDNASGVAALFEVARIFSMKQYQPERSIELVALAAEELMYFGHSGGQAYVDSALAHDVILELMINNDMIAYTGTDDWEITISNYNGCEWLTDMAEEITSKYTSIQPDVRNPSSQAGADCKYFYEAGIPCVYFMEKDFNPFYHTVSDLVVNADMNYCAEAVKISVGLLLQLDGWVVSTKEQPSVLATDVFPNPTSGKLNIRYSDGTRIDNLNYRLMNSLGQVVQAGIAGNSIDMHYLPEGIYFCSLNNNTQIKTFKVLKF